MVLHRAQLTLEDSALPGAISLEGRGLFAGGAQQGTRQVIFSVGDEDSGVDHVELHRQDGALAGMTTGAAGCVWDQPAPCPRQRGQETINVDTTGLGEGAQTLDAWIYDAAGNRRTQTLPTIIVDNIPAPRVTDGRTPTSHASQARCVSVAGDRVRWDWDGSGRPVSLSRRWSLSTDDGKTWIPTPSTGSVFTPDASMEGKLLRLEVTATSTEGSTTEVTDPAKIGARPSSSTTVQVPGSTGQQQTLSSLTSDNGTGGSPETGSLVSKLRAESRKVSYGARVRLRGTLADGAGRRSPARRWTCTSSRSTASEPRSVQ